MGRAIRHMLKSASFLGLTALALVVQPIGVAQAGDQPQADDQVQAADKSAENAAAKQAQAEQGGELWIGVQCVTVDETLRSQLNLKPGEGLLVRDVAPDSPATSAGLQRTDVLLSAHGNRLTSVADLQQAVKKSFAQEMEIELLRAGKPLTVSVKPQTRPDLSWPGVAKLPPREREVLRQWIEQMHRGDGQFPPMAFRFFHPGMLLPGGVEGDVQLPDDASVTIFRQGKLPAKITVRQGDKTWEVVEDKLSDLPDHLRPAVEAMLPMAPGRAIPMPAPDAGDSSPASAGSTGKSVDEQLNDLKQRLEALERLNRRQLKE